MINQDLRFALLRFIAHGQLKSRLERKENEKEICREGAQYRYELITQALIRKVYIYMCIRKKCKLCRDMYIFFVQSSVWL